MYNNKLSIILLNSRKTSDKTNIYNNTTSIILLHSRITVDEKYNDKII